MSAMDVDKKPRFEVKKVRRFDLWEHGAKKCNVEDSQLRDFNSPSSYRELADISGTRSLSGHGVRFWAVPLLWILLERMHNAAGSSLCLRLGHHRLGGAFKRCG